MDFIKIYDDPNTPEEDGFINFAEKMGITTLDQPDYGLSLTLGGGDVTLVDLTSAYATIANSGLKIPPVGITKIEDYRGNLIYEYEIPEGDQVTGRNIPTRSVPSSRIMKPGLLCLGEIQF